MLALPASPRESGGAGGLPGCRTHVFAARRYGVRGIRRSSPGGRTGRCGAALALLVLFAFVKLLREVVLHTHLAECVELAFQIVDVLFLVGEDLFEQRA